jgi:thiol-disulfide isomerase/thioredoxin
VLIVVLNAQFHLFQEAINPFTVVIVLENTNQMILLMIDHHETIEVQDIPETIEVQDIPETIEVQDIPEIILDQVEVKVINF